jgi:hypothetical protein
MSKQQVQATTRSTSKSIANIRAYQRSKELEHKIDPPKIQELVLKQKQRLNPQITPFEVLRFPCICGQQILVGWELAVGFSSCICKVIPLQPAGFLLKQSK